MCISISIQCRCLVDHNPRLIYHISHRYTFQSNQFSCDYFKNICYWKRLKCNRYTARTVVRLLQLYTSIQTYKRYMFSTFCANRSIHVSVVWPLSSDRLLYSNFSDWFDNMEIFGLLSCRPDAIRKCLLFLHIHLIHNDYWLLSNEK